VVDVREEEALVDGDVGGILVGGGVSGALIRVSFSTNVGVATLLVVPLLFFLLPLLVVVPVTFTRNWTFSNEVSHLVLEDKPNANHVRARISNSCTQQLHNWTSSHSAQIII
jgi:hypothetical protein